MIEAGHTVTLGSAGAEIGKALTVKGTLTLNNGSLTIGIGTRYDNYSDGVFTLAGGGTLNGKGTVLARCGKVTSSATSENWGFIGGEVQFVHVSTAGGSVHYDYSYVSFTSSADQVFSTQGSIWSPGGYPRVLSFKHCVFAGPQNVTFGQSGYTPGDTEVDIQYCDFRNCSKVNLGGIETAVEDVSRNLRHCTFYNNDGSACLISYYRLSGELDMTGTVGVRVRMQGNPVQIADSFFMNDNESTPLLPAGTNANSIEDSYFYTTATTSGNPRLLTGISIKNVVHEGPRTADGRGFTLFVGARDFSAENILSIGRGTVFSPQNTSTAVKAMIHNVSKLVPAGETGSPVLQNVFTDTVLRNCLQTTFSGKSAGYLCQGTGGSLDADYNCIFGLAGHYASGLSSSGQGSGDISVDPGFADASRGFLSWASSVSGTAEVTMDQACLYLLAKNGYDPASGTQKHSGVSNSSVAELIAWVRAGYMPQNPQLRYGDNSYFGAVEPDTGRVDTIVIEVEEKYLPSGTQPNPSANRYKIDTAGWTVTGVLVQGVLGKLVEENGQWYYILERPVDHSPESMAAGVAENADAASLRMKNSSQGNRVLMVQINVRNDVTAMSAPDAISGALGAEGEISVNAGANSPAEIGLTVDGRNFTAGEIVAHSGCKMVLEMDPVVTSTGLGAGGGIFCPRICPDEPTLMFLASDMGGVYRSTNGGAHWTMLNWRVLHNHHKGPGALFCKDKQIIWPGYGITSDTYKIGISHDTGVTWRVEAADSAPISGIPWRQGALVGLEKSGLHYYFFGEDLGTNGEGWGSAFEIEGKVPAIVGVDDNSALYIYNDTQLKKLTINDAGTASTEIVYTFESAVSALAFDGKQLLASRPDAGIYKSLDFGKNWSKITDYLKVNTLFIHPSHPECYYLAQTSESSSFKFIYKTLDGGASYQSIFYMHATEGNVEHTWIQTDLYWGYYIVANGFYVLPGSSPEEDTIMVSTQGELFRSDNGGVNFYAPIYRNRHDAESLDMHESIGLEVTSVWGVKENPLTPGELHALYTDIGGGLSLDYGKTWAGVSRTLSHRNTMYGLAFDPDVKGKMWCACSSVHDIPHWSFIKNVTGNGAVDLSTDGGKTWKTPYTYSAQGALPRWICCDIALDPASPVNSRTLYAALYSLDPFSYESEGSVEHRGNDYGGVWKSTDGGVTWARKIQGLQTGNINKHVYRLHLSASGKLYAMVTAANTVKGILDGGIYVSSDGAENWSLVGPSQDNLKKWLTSFTFGETEEEIYCTTVTAWGATSKGGLHRTLDGGVTWETIFDDTTLQACNVGISAAASYDHYMSIFVEGDFIMLGGTQTGCYFSYDRGKSWTSWTEFPFGGVQSISKLSDGRLALTSFGGGIFFAPYPPESGHTSLRTGRLTVSPAPVHQTVQIRAVNSEGIVKSKDIQVSLQS